MTGFAHWNLGREKSDAEIYREKLRKAESLIDSIMSKDKEAAARLKYSLRNPLNVPAMLDTLAIMKRGPLGK